MIQLSPGMNVLLAADKVSYNAFVRDISSKQSVSILPLHV